MKPMKSLMINMFAIVASAILFASYEFGGLRADLAFFYAAAVMTVYAGYQLSARDGMTFREALAEIWTQPESYPRRTAYWAYIGCSAVLGFIVLQSVVGEII